MYQHVQRSPLHLLLYLPAIAMFIAAWLLYENLWTSIIIAAVGILLAFLALTFQTLTVSGDDKSLTVRYGPLNVFGTRIAYEDISQVQCGTSSLIDGWGIHFIPFRGWTFNLWGFECAKFKRKGTTVRIGTDDSKNLVEFLQQMIQSPEDVNVEEANQ